jgi:hypothetical protein
MPASGQVEPDSIFGRIFYGKPVATFPENAPTGGAGRNDLLIEAAEERLLAQVTNRPCAAQQVRDLAPPRVERKRLRRGQPGGTIVIAFVSVPLPDITHVFYGRDDGYGVERIALDQATESISASDTRKKAGLA